MMKRLFSFLLIATALTLTLDSCHKVVRDQTFALVDEMNDSVLVAKIDGTRVNFDITEAVFTNGAVMYGDSVIIHYIGDLSKKRAFAESVHLIDRPSQVITVPADGSVDSTKEMKLRDVDPKASNRAKRASDIARQFIKK